MSIDYEQLKDFVKEAMFTGGGINEPSAPEGIPHRMLAADPDSKEQDMGDPKANKLYDVALTAREATEQLVEALDDPTFDQAYEYAFKASACLRKVLNSIEESGAHPMPDQRVVAQPRDMQRYSAGGGDYGGGTMIGMGAGDGGFGGLEEQAGLGAKRMSQSTQARAMKDTAQSIEKGDALQNVDDEERAILHDVQALLVKIADEGELASFKPQLQSVLKNMLDRNSRRSPAKDLDLGKGAV